MTVAELIAKLQEMPQKMDVFLDGYACEGVELVDQSDNTASDYVDLFTEQRGLQR